MAFQLNERPTNRPYLRAHHSIRQLGLDYTTLRDLLKAEDYRKADDETRALLIKQAGADAIKRGWVYFTEIKTIPNKDLQTMDNL